jgi:hypothetical protein
MSAIMASTPVQGQVLLEENFTFTGPLTSNGWTAVSAAGTSPINAASPGLSYVNLPSSGVGNAASISTTGEDDRKLLNSTNSSGSVYSSCLLNLSAAQASGDYFYTLSSGATGFIGRVFARSSGAGFQLGILKSSGGVTTPTYDTNVLSFGTTYLIATKIERLGGTTTDDVASLWVNPPLGASETAATVTNSAGNDQANIDSVVLRQGNAANAPTLRLGNILVGTTWSSVTPTAAAGAPSIASFTPTSGSGGTIVTINGANLDGATLVTFNGATASFSIVNSSQITATVPAGATEGPIAVTTPQGVAQSITSFIIPTISIGLPGSIKEGKTGVGTLTLNAAATADVSVGLSTSPTNVLTVDTPVAIATGATSSTFNISAGLVSSNTPVQVSAAAAGYASLPASINVEDIPAASLTSSGYAQAFSSFTNFSSLPLGWSLNASVITYTAWATVDTGAKYSASGVDVFGYQHTSSTGVVEQVLTLQNDTGAPITSLTVSYNGRAARVDQTRLPSYTVTVDGVAQATLGYSTSEGDNVAKTASITGLNIAAGQVFQIVWTSDRGLTTTGTSRQIGISNVAVTLGASSLPPTVADMAVNISTISQSSAGVSANVVSDGGSPLTARGFVYSETSVNPTPAIGGSGVTVVADSSLSTGALSASLSGLSANTGYSVRAYATNNQGTSYSSVVAFPTLAASPSFTGSFSQTFDNFSSATSSSLATGAVSPGWTAVSSTALQTYSGTWTTSSFSGGFFGGVSAPGVLGYQHTSGTGTLTVTLQLVNNTGSAITELNVQYLGRVAELTGTRFPEWSVTVAGVAVPELAYSTGSGTDETKTASVTGLNIPNGAQFSVTWVSTRGENATGSSRRIGLANVLIATGGAGTPSITADPTSLTNLVAFVNQPGTAQQITVTGTGLSSPIQFTAAPSDQYEVAAQGGSFGVAATLPASGGVALVRIKSGATAGSVGSAQLTFDSGSTSNTVALNGTRISGGTGGLEPGLQTFASDLNFTATARFTWVLKGNTVDGRGTNFSGVNVGGNLGVTNGAAFDVVLNGAGSTTDFANSFWQSARSWLVFNVTGNTTGSFTLGAITPDSGGKYYAGYGSFGLRTDAGGDVFLDWTPGSAPTGPVISVGATSLNLPGTTTNVAGISTNFTVSGASLTGDITVAATDAVNFAVSTNSSSGFASSLVLTQTAGAVSSIPVYVRLTGASAGTFTNTVTAASAGATTRTVSVTGTVTNPGAPAINVSTNALGGFTALRGTPSASTNLTVTGTNLSGSNIAVTSSNNFYEISTNSFATLGSNALTLAPTGGVVAVRISTNAPATNSLPGRLALSGGGATNSVTLSGVVTNSPAVITVSTNSLPAFSSTTNVASAAQSFFAQGTNLSTNITVTAPTGFQVAFTSNNADFGTAVTLTNSAGTATNREIFVRMSASAVTNTLNSRNVTLTTTGASNQVTVSGTITAAPPSLTATPGTLTNFLTSAGTASAALSYNLSGSNLGAVSVVAPSGFQVALTNTNSAFGDSVAPVATGGSLNTNIFVRVSASAATNTNLNGSVTNSSGSTNVLVSLQAKVAPAPVISVNPNVITGLTATVSSPQGTWNAYSNFYLAPTAAGWAGATNTNATNVAWGYYAANVNGIGFPTQIGAYFTAQFSGSGSQSLYQYSSVAPLGSGTLVGASGWADTGGAGFPSYADTSSWGSSLGRYDNPWFPGAPGFGLGLSNLIWFQGGWLSVPGAEGIAPILSWKAPYTTSYTFSGLFVAGSQGTNGASVAIVDSSGGSPILARTALASTASNSFNFTKFYAAGDVVQFQVGSDFKTGNAVGLSVNVATVPGTPGASTNFIASGTNLLGNITVSVPGPDFAISTNNTDFTDTLTLFTNAFGAVTNTPVYVRLTGATNGTFTTNISLFSGTASTNVSVTGTVTERPPAVLSAAPTTLSNFSTITGVASTNQSFDLTASNLLGPVNLSVTNGYEISLSTNSGFSTSLSVATVSAVDNAANYSGGWTNGANGGTGFGPWTIAANNNPTNWYAGAFVGDPNSAGITGFGTNAFGLYANPSGTAATVSVDRPFNAPLKVGETFSFQWAVNWDAGGGNKGFNVYSGGVGGTQLANVNQGDFPGNITFNGANAITNYGTGPMTWSFTMTSSTNLLVTSTARDGGTNIAFATNIAVSGPPDAARWYTTGMTPGDQRQSYFNNLQIAYAGGNISNLPVYVRIATNAPVAEASNSLTSRVTISSASATNVFVDLSGSVASNPVITQSNSLVPFSSVQGFPSDAQQFEVGGINLITNVLVTPPGGYEVSLDGSGWAVSTNVPALPRDGVVTAQTNVFIRVAPTAPVGSASGDIVLSSTQASNVVIPVSRVVGGNTGPQLTANPTSLPAFATDLGTNSATNNFALVGSGLSNSVVLTAPSGFQLSTDGTNFAASNQLAPRPSGYLSNNIAVRLAGSSAGIFGGNITAASGGTNAAVAVTGTVYADAVTQIAATPLALSNFATTNGAPSVSQSFLGSARNLTNDLVATASGGYEVSTNNTDFFASVNIAPVGGTIGPVAFHARISSNAPPTNSLIGKVELSSGSAPTTVVTLDGEVYPVRPLSVVLTAPTNNPTIIAPGSTVRLSATVSDTNTSGQPVQIATFEFRTNNVAIPGAFVTNVVSPYTLTYDWTPSPAGLPAGVSAWAVDVDGWEGSSATVTVRNPDPGEPIVGFTPPVAFPTNSQIEAVAPATNGAFYIGGSFTNLVRSNGSVPVTNASTRVARILADGTVDSEFITETGPNNTVRSLLYSAANQGLYIGGAFSNVSGAGRPSLARLAVGQTNIDDGTLDTNFAPALTANSGSPIVNAIVQQYDGKILVGGIFATAGTGTNAVGSANLARFESNGTRDVSFVPPQPGGEVRSIALQPDGKILIAGSFAQVAGQPRKGLARLNIDGTLDTTFNVGTGTSGGFNGTVWSVAVGLDGFVYAGGQFSSFNGKSVYNNLAKLSSTGELATRFNFAGALTGGINNVVRNVQMRPGGNILVSGLFTQIANSVLFPTPVPAGRVAELIPDGTIETAFNPAGTGANNSVLNAATLANGNLVLVGAFTQFNGKAFPRMVVLAGSSAADSVVTSPPFFTVDAGSSFDFAFTSSGGAPYEGLYAELPRGVSFDAASGTLSGIPLDAGAFDMDVSASSPGGSFGDPSLFRLQVLPKIVPYDTWKQVWFTPSEQTNASVSGPSIVGSNPSGQPNFTVYALSGGSPKEEGTWILPEAWPEYFEGQQYLTYSVWHYPLAAARYTVQVTGDLKTWETNTIAITNGPGFFQVRPPVPMSLTNRQFLRLEISNP